MKTINKKQLELLPHLSQVVFALFCAKQVQHLSNDPKAAIAIKTVEKYLIGKATKEECKAAASDAYTAAATYATHAAAAAAHAADAAAYAAAYAAYAAGNAAAAAGNAAAAATRAAAYAADAANTAYDAAEEEDKAKTIKEQNEYYDNLLSMVDGRIDKMLIGVK